MNEILKIVLNLQPLQNTKPLFNILISSLILMILFTSCTGVRRLQENIYNSRDKEKGNFVQTNDGTVLQGESLNVKYPFFKKAYVQINQQDKVRLRDVEVMQNDNGYYRNIDGYLAPRIKKGGINTFLTYRTSTSYSGPSAGNMSGWSTTTVPVYYLQKTDSGQVMLMTPSVINDMVSDYQPAKDFMDQYYVTQRKVRTWSLINTAAVIGGVALMVTGIKRADNNTTVKPQAYAGAGLFVGGIINGIVNKIRRGSNYKNLELSIDEYNARSSRRGK